MSGLVRYAPRHFVDLLMTRGLGIVAVGLVFILPVSLSETAAEGPASMERLFGEMLATLSVFFTLIASYGLTGQDVRQGYYRFVFAKPVSPVWYYATSYVLATVVFGLGLAATVGLFAVMILPVWPTPHLGEAVANYFLLSTLILVFSRLTNGDWLIALVALGLSQGLRSAYPAEESLMGKVLNVILPPTDTGRLFPLDGGVNWDGLLGQMGYAAFLLAVALLIVRRIPMGSAR